MPEIYPERIQNLPLPPVLEKIALDIKAQKGDLYIVGGVVRDCLLGLPSKDFDFEVYGVSEAQLQGILKSYGNPNLVGKSFGVFTLNLNGHTCDFAFPRKEKKVEAGHRGFEVETDPGLAFADASRRRDFTINAMGVPVLTRQLEDPHGGLSDLGRGILRHVSEAFGEDPLRALRAMQFAGRFQFTLDPETLKICSQQPLQELPPERKFGEFKKLLLKSSTPSRGMETLDAMNLLSHFPELSALKGVQQDPEWHPEGDVWTHNNMVLDAAAEIRDAEIPPENEFDKLVLMFSALCHDLGKPLSTHFKDGRWRSPGHDVAGDKVTRNFLRRLTNDVRLTESVVAYVREHLKPALLYNVRHEVKQSAIRRLSLKVDIPGLVRVAKADHFVRTTADALAREFPAGDWLLEQGADLNVLMQAPQPLLTGKMLISLGMRPGKEMGNLIKESFEEQLEGRLGSVEEVMEWARQKLT